jgi:hypothetical protein
MNGAEVYPVLQQKNINRLYHANTVATSVTLLRLRCLASRGYVERNRLVQTDQYTDEVDRRFGIWDDVFTDSVDIHARIRDRNQYGPVVFVFDARMLATLSADIDVLITKSNPTKWTDGQQHGDRYFTTVAELSAGLCKGTFDQMITYRIPEGLLPFGTHLQQIVLDDPRVNRPDNIGTFTVTQRLLQEAAAGRVVTQISQRACDAGCKCSTTYAGNPDLVRKFFALT